MCSIYYVSFVICSVFYVRKFGSGSKKIFRDPDLQHYTVSDSAWQNILLVKLKYSIFFILI